MGFTGISGGDRNCSNHFAESKHTSGASLAVSILPKVTLSVDICGKRLLEAKCRVTSLLWS